MERLRRKKSGTELENIHRKRDKDDPESIPLEAEISYKAGPES